MADRGGNSRDLKVLERRRLQAVGRFVKATDTLASIARELKVSRMSVSRWYRQWKQSGKVGLKAAARAGRKPGLSARQLRRVEIAMRKGALWHGFSADLWTLPRVATVIERLTGIRYHPGHVWKILGAMKWTLQKPGKQAKERDPNQVEYWKTVRWLEVKKTLRSSAPGSSSKTNPDLRSSLRSAEPGRPAGKRRS
jgi:transposase